MSPALQKIKAVLIFCEGPHDIAFTRKILKHFWDCEDVVQKFSQYPAPFNSFFPNQIKQHALGDLELDMAHKFFLPDKVLQKNEDWFFLFNCGGNVAVKNKDEDKSPANKVRAFLETLLPLLKNAAIFPKEATAVIGQTRYLFINDADDQGAGAVRANLGQNFAALSGDPWLVQSWQIRDDNPRAAISGDIASYVVGQSHEQGTLEDLLMPIFRHAEPQLLAKAETAIDDLFVWDIETAPPKERISRTGKRNKAIITLAGQREVPGGSMSVVMGHAKKLVREAIWKDNPDAEAFADFLTEFVKSEG